MLHKFLKLFGKSAKPATAVQDGSAMSAGNAEHTPAKPMIRQTKYQIGQVVHHRMFDFRGVIFDVDPVYSNSEEWYLSIPEDVRPHREQPYYHLFAENDKSHYTAYVSEQNLVPDTSEDLIKNPDIDDVFIVTDAGEYQLRSEYTN